MAGRTARRAARSAARLTASLTTSLTSWLAAGLLTGAMLASAASADPPAGERIEVLRARIDRARDPAARLELARVLLDAGRAREARDETTIANALAPG
ncbi:MAG: hypothetical protein IT378_19015, partial [Sandaracinaceae bacterium]|nr:hypothetical protein [Sandaracinaceae bacterium]